MNDSTLNFTELETSTGSSLQSLELKDILCLSVFFFNFIFGCPIHLYVVWLIVTKSGVESEFFILNFSICELGNCLNCLFFICSIYLKRLATLPLFLLGLIYTCRPLFQCLMCFEQYLAVVHPITFLKYKPLRYRVICYSTGWMITFFTCFFCLFRGMKDSQFLSLQFLPSLSIQLFCLLAVLRALKQSGPGDRKKVEENRTKRKAFLIILTTTVSMIFIYVPFTVTGLVSVFTKYNISGFWFIGISCYALGGYIQPVLYLHRAKKLSNM